MMLVSYVKILVVVRQHHVTIGNSSITSTTPVRGNVGVQGGGWAASIRSARSLFFIGLAFYVSYIPTIVINQVDSGAVPIWFIFAIRTLEYVSPITNSLLYILLYRSTRRYIARVFFG